MVPSLVYQPIVRPESGEVVGWEALVRPDPEHLVAEAVGCGRIREFGLDVLRAALAQISRLPSGHVAVNVEPSQLCPCFTESVLSALHASGVPPKRLVVEITEREALPPGADAWLTDLASHGVAIAIADLGTGHAGLERLSASWAAIAKLDAGVLHGSRQRRCRRDVLTSLVALVHAHRLLAVVEGVETAEDRSLVVGAGADYAQGFFFGVPGTLDTPAEVAGLRSA